MNPCRSGLAKAIRGSYTSLLLVRGLDMEDEYLPPAELGTYLPTYLDQISMSIHYYGWIRWRSWRGGWHTLSPPPPGPTRTLCTNRAGGPPPHGGMSSTGGTKSRAR